MKTQFAFPGSLTSALNELKIPAVKKQHVFKSVARTSPCHTLGVMGWSHSRFTPGSLTNPMTQKKFSSLIFIILFIQTKQGVGCGPVPMDPRCAYAAYKNCTMMGLRGVWMVRPVPRILLCKDSPSRWYHLTLLDIVLNERAEVPTWCDHQRPAQLPGNQQKPTLGTT
jgi:hypothetical protein